MHGRTWQAWLVPGGLLLALAAALVNSPLFVQVAPSLSFYYVAVFAAGLLLAWRFNSSRLLFSLLALLLAHRAVAFFSSGPIQTGPLQTGNFFINDTRTTAISRESAIGTAVYI